jgi:Protein of unknown function (DUF3969)
MSLTSMPLMFRMDDRSDVSQLVAVMSLGLCAAISGGSVSIEEAERRLFNPRVVEQLRGLGVSEVLIEIVHLGTELEDVQSLIPERLGESLAEMQVKTLDFLTQAVGSLDFAA